MSEQAEKQMDSPLSMENEVTSQRSGVDEKPVIMNFGLQTLQNLQVSKKEALENYGKDSKEYQSLKELEKHSKKVFKTFDNTNGFLLQQMELYNQTLGDHFLLLQELKDCIKFIGTRTSQLKELRNFIRRQSTSLDQIFPYFFQFKDQLDQEGDIELPAAMDVMSGDGIQQL